MEFHDQHVHTCFSHDSKVEIEEYLEILVRKNIKTFASTDHLELFVNRDMDLVPKFDLQKEKMKEFSEKYNIEMLMGVEIGYKKSEEKRFNDHLESKPFDVVLMAIHDDGEFEIGSYEFQKDRPKLEIYNDYLDLCLKAVEGYENYDILAHVDYMIRYMHKGTDEIDVYNHREKLEKIFNGLIKNGKTLEVNTRFIYRNNDPKHLEKILEIYKSCGGEFLSLGSDSHIANDFYGGFETAIKLIKDKGFNSIRVFKNRKPIDIAI